MTTQEADHNTPGHAKHARHVHQSTILLIDDEPVNAHLISQLLQEHEVIVALNGTDGLSMAVDLVPDLILLDINMPDILGFEVCTRLRANPATYDIPVIFLTTMDATEDKIRGFESGGVDYIVKPYSKEEVVARVNTHLVIHVMQRDLKVQYNQLIRYKSILEQLVAERTSGPTALHPLRGRDYSDFLMIIETLAEIDEAQQKTSRDPEVMMELEAVRTTLRDVTRVLGPRIARLRGLLAPADAS
ncbi:MAG: response regulator [Alphaproteobacteria bacterium]|nr:response regulator [Alphaproteobacteria bacterium]